MNQQTTTATATSFTFSDAAIKTYPMPATGSVRISDTACRGLALRITAKGVRTFTVRQQRSGKRTLTAIGTYPELSIAEARIKATEIITGETAGASQRTVADIFETNYWPLRERAVRPSTARLSLGQYNLRIKTELGHLPVSEVTKRDITSMQDKWRSELSSINTPQLVVSHFFSWLVERDYIPVSPVPRTKVKRAVRERTMSLSELRELWSWAESFGADGLLADMHATVKLWLLTGLRRREVTSAEWRELPVGIRQDFIPAGANTEEEDVPVWRIPAGRMKAKVEHVVPIGRPVADVLRALPQGRTSERWVFPNERRSGPTGRDWSELIKASPVEDICIRDIRRSVATQWATRLGVSDDVIGLSLGHRPATITASVYQRSLRLRERAGIQERWRDLLSG